MDQAAFENQSVLWYFQKCGKNKSWIAISVYVLVAIIKERLNLERRLYTILQILSITLFEKMPINQGLEQVDYKTEITTSRIQLKLYDI